MKKIFFVFLIYANLVFAQEDSIEIKFAATLTAIGKPIGDKTSESIDKDGGRITSADKKLELILPQDAVLKKTDISIQSVENTLAPGNGSAYHLEPSGMNFQKPLQVIFHYSSKEEAPIAGLRNIAWQDDKGQWFALDSSVVDTVARTVTGNITHFSTWVFFDYFNLTPTSARLKVGKKMQLQILCTYPGGLSDDFKSQILKNIKFSGYANGVRGGNAATGFLSAVTGHTEDRFVNYTAPANVPDNNPVAVSIEAANISFNRKSYSKLKLVSNITIYDKAYEIKVSGWNQQWAGKCMLASVDSSSCMIALNGSKTRLGYIQNMDVKIVIDKKCQCNMEIWSSGHDVGPVDIEGASKIEITSPDPPKNRVINVWFIRTAGVIPGMRSSPCGPGHVPVSVPPFALPALPFFLSWEDDGKEHLVKGGDDKNGFEVRILPVKDD